jgi:hypothetical protein
MAEDRTWNCRIGNGTRKRRLPTWVASPCAARVAERGGL